MCSTKPPKKAEVYACGIWREERKIVCDHRAIQFWWHNTYSAIAGVDPRHNKLAGAGDETSGTCYFGASYFAARNDPLPP
jgi:hypothetical protein